MREPAKAPAPEVNFAVRHVHKKSFFLRIPKGKMK